MTQVWASRRVKAMPLLPPTVRRLPSALLPASSNQQVCGSVTVSQPSRRGSAQRGFGQSDGPYLRPAISLFLMPRTCSLPQAEGFCKDRRLPGAVPQTEPLLHLTFGGAGAPPLRVPSADPKYRMPKCQYLPLSSAPCRIPLPSATCESCASFKLEIRSARSLTNCLFSRMNPWPSFLPL